MKDFIVHIKRELKDHGGATIKLSDIHGLKWSRISGGRKIRTAYPFIYGYINPDNIISGEVACSGTHIIRRALCPRPRGKAPRPAFQGNQGIPAPRGRRPPVWAARSRRRRR